MNIYITPENEKHLRKEGSMSGLINDLLAAHFKGSSGVRKHHDSKESWEPVLSEPVKIEKLIKKVSGPCEHGAGKGFCKYSKCKNSYTKAK